MQSWERIVVFYLSVSEQRIIRREAFPRLISVHEAKHNFQNGGYEKP
jgi:hypothetical protein